jgi:16S rRNA (cytidine1402-2'-O)-methyltransferase
MGKLYLVGPLGDVWRDIPLRALRVLRDSSLIVGRDVDSVREWLCQEDIHTPLIDLCDDGAVAQLWEALSCGEVVWLIQWLEDLSEPARGVLLRLVERGIEPVSVPGPSNAISGLIVSGLPTDSLTYLGTLPECSGRRRALFKAVAYHRRTLICEIKTERLPDVLRDLVACLGDRRVTLHDRYDTWRGQASLAPVWPGGGRLALAIEGARRDPVWSTERVDDEVHKLLSVGASPREVAREVARRSGRPRREVYQYVVSVRKED